MGKGVNTTNLGYLGSEYQLRLVKCFIEDQQFFSNLYEIIDQNMFTDEHLRRIVALMKDRYADSETVPTYMDIEVLIRSKITDVIAVEQCLSTIIKMRNLTFDAIDLIEDEAEKFFKQQNLSKALNKASDIIKKGNANDYYTIEDLIKKALETNTKQDYGFRLFENIEADLSDDYRQTISTGCKELDESLYGGLGKGELGLIVSPMGVGKAQPLTSKVLTPNGFKLMGEMKVGDEIIGRDGNAHKVTGVFPQGKRPIYKVSFSNGSSCECDIEHLWTIKKRHTNKWKTLSLKEIIEKGILTEKTKRFKWIVPNNEKIEFNTSVSDDICYQNSEKRLKYFDKFRWRISKGGVNKTIKIKSFEIANKLCFISRSLGYLTAFSYIKKNDCYKLTIKLKNDVIFITNIEYIREDEAQCIMVDSDEHLYLTDDFIVTHNTSITTGFAASAATNKCELNNYQGFKVLHFFFEDKEQAIRRKYYGHVLDIDACELSKPEIRPIAIKQLNEDSEIKRMLKNNIIAKRLSSGEVTASEIKNKIKQYISIGFKPDLVIIDYFECLKYEKSDINSDEWSREGITMRKLESLCNDLNIAIWCPVQGTKGSIGVDVVTLQHAGGSVKKTQIGHIVLTLAQTDEQKEQGRLNVFIGKLRAVKIGRTSFRNVKFNNGTGKFDMSDLDETENELNSSGISNTMQNIAKSVKQEQRKKF